MRRAPNSVSAVCQPSITSRDTSRAPSEGMFPGAVEVTIYRHESTGRAFGDDRNAEGCRRRTVPSGSPTALSCLSGRTAADRVARGRRADHVPDRDERHARVRADLQHRRACPELYASALAAAADRSVPHRRQRVLRGVLGVDRSLAGRFLAGSEQSGHPDASVDRRCGPAVFSGVRGLFDIWPRESTIEPPASGPSRHNLRIYGLEFTARIVDLHLPVHAALPAIDVGGPRRHFVVERLEFADATPATSPSVSRVIRIRSGCCC